MLERVGTQAYKLDLPSSIKIHPVFHTGVLCKFKDDGRYQPPPPNINIDGEAEWEVESIIGHRDRSRNSHTTKSGQRPNKCDYLVKLSGYPIEHHSWEPEKHMTNCADLKEAYGASQV